MLNILEQLPKNIRKHGNPRQEDKTSKKLLGCANGIEISKPHSWKRSKSKINGDESLSLTFLFNNVPIFIAQKMIMIIMVSIHVETEDIPILADEIGKDHNA